MIFSKQHVCKEKRTCLVSDKFFVFRKAWVCALQSFFPSSCWQMLTAVPSLRRQSALPDRLSTPSVPFLLPAAVPDPFFSQPVPGALHNQSCTGRFPHRFRQFVLPAPQYPHQWCHITAAPDRKTAAFADWFRCAFSFPLAF